MNKEFSPDHLDVVAFAKAGATLTGVDPIAHYPRLADDYIVPDQEATGITHTKVSVAWSAVGEHMPEIGGIGQFWLHLQAHAVLPMTCQRCLQPADIVLQVQRSFRFVKDEASAQAQDDDCEEDLLAISRDFDLHMLIEDELLMEIPLVPRHDECPQAIPMTSSDTDFLQAVAEKPHPFAILDQLRPKGNAG